MSYFCARTKDFYPNVVYEFDYKARPGKTIHVKAQARGFIVIGKNFMSGAKAQFDLSKITNVRPYKVTLSK